MLAALTGLLRQRRVLFFPALDSIGPGMGDHADRFRTVEAVVSKDLAEAAEQHVVLEHCDFTVAGGRDAEFEAVATLFVLDTVSSLAAAVSAIAHALCQGGVWVNCGPLRKHREAPAFTFADVAAFAEASGLEVLEDHRFTDCEYVPREATLGVREVYDVQ